MKKQYWRSFGVFLLAVFVVVSSAGIASAAGFAVSEKSVKGLGSAFAGGAASAEDASTVYYNPAGMTRLSGIQVDAGLSAIAYSFEATDKGSPTVLTPLLSVNLSGGNGGDGGMTKAIPGLFYTQSINDNLTAGIGITAPFGLGTEYEAGWVGRYHTIKSDVMTIDINPSIAYRINDQVSIGLGISAQYLDAELGNAIDIGTIVNAHPQLNAFAAPLGILPQNADGNVVLTADDWSYGFNVGILFELSDKSRLGFSYRSKTAFEVAGDAVFETPASANVPLAALGNATLAQTLGMTNTTGTAKIDMPGALSASVYHELDNGLALMADLTWMNWSVLEELRVKFGNGADDNVTTFSWDDTWRMAVGAAKAINDQLTIRCGLAYDPTPIPNPNVRTPRVPDADRTWFSLGGSYKMSEKMGLDFGYTYIMSSSTTIEKTPTGEDMFRGGLQMDIEGSSHIFGAALSMAF